MTTNTLPVLKLSITVDPKDVHEKYKTLQLEGRTITVENADGSRFLAKLGKSYDNFETGKSYLVLKPIEATEPKQVNLGKVEKTKKTSKPTEAKAPEAKGISAEDAAFFAKLKLAKDMGII